MPTRSQQNRYPLFALSGQDIWVRTVAGRLKSDYHYSAAIVYNNYPWPQASTDKQRQAIETVAQAVLDARQLELTVALRSASTAHWLCSTTPTACLLNWSRPMLP